MKFVALFAVVLGTAMAQSLAVTSPANNATVSGTSFPLAVSTNLSSISAVEYDVDGELAGISRTGSYSYSWNTYFASNGQHTLRAIARDAQNRILSSTGSISFLVENPLPQRTTPTTDISVSFNPVAQLKFTYGVNGAFLVTSYKCATVCAVASGSPKYSAYAGSPQSVTLANTTTGDGVVGFALINSATDTLSSVTAGGKSATLGAATHGLNGSTYTVQPYAVYNVTGAGSTTVTAATGAGSNVEIWAWDVHNMASSAALDVNLVMANAGQDQWNLPLNLAQSNEIVLSFMGCWGNYCASGAANTAGWTLTMDPDNNYMSAAQTIVPPSGDAWWGVQAVNATVNGPNSGISKTFTYYVDGMVVKSNTDVTAATDTGYLDTTKYVNGPHQVVVRADGCSGCASNGKWTDMGAWEQPETFSNTVVATELLASARESLLCTSASTNCPTSATITARYLNTDGSTTPTTISSCGYNPSGGAATGGPVFATSLSGGNCSITQNAVGEDFATITAPNGMTRKIWVMVADPSKWPAGAVGSIGNFASDGSIRQGYSASPQSLWYASMFQSGGAFLYPDGAVQAGPAFAQAGFNAVEWTVDTPASCGAGNSAQFETCINYKLSTLKNNFSSYGQGRLKYVRLLGDSWFRGTPEMAAAILGPSASWTPPAYQDLMSMSAASGIVLSQAMSDETGSSWDGHLLEGTNTGGILVGTNGFTSLTGDGSTCTIAWTNATLNGSLKFIITGSGQSALDYNTATNSPIFTGNGQNVNPLTFSCSFNGNITSGATQIHPYVNWTFDSGLNACAPGGSSPGPCTQWLHYDMFKTIRTWQTNVPGFPKAVWTMPNGCCTFGIATGSGGPSGVVGGVKAGDYWENFFTPGLYSGTMNYLPGEPPVYDLIGLGDQLRGDFNWMDQSTPLISETSGLVNNYAFQGYPVAIASCSGNTITTSVPHGLSNVITTDMTRVWISGSPGGSCDGNYFVTATPTATTISVVLANATFNDSGTGGTITFHPSGATYTATAIASSNSGNGPGSWDATDEANCNTTTFKNHRGETFTVSGNTSSNINAMTGYFSWVTFDNCTGHSTGGQPYWRQVPNLPASTGGTVVIMPSLGYKRGISWASNSDIGPLYQFASVNEVAIAGGSGQRAYVFTGDPNSWDRSVVGLNTFVLDRTFNAQEPAWYNSGGIQAGINPVSDYMDGIISRITMAHTDSNLIHAYLSKFEYGQRLPSPDYGQFFDASARTNSYGNVLMIQYLGQNTQSCTANLAPYLVPGQPVYRYDVTWSNITLTPLPAGTTSDTTNCQSASLRIYVFPQAGQFTPQQPTISVRLSDIPGATQVLVQYAYTPRAFQPSVLSVSYLSVFDCGAGTCVLPADRNIGPVYYRLVYLDANSHALASSDIQVL